MSEEHDIEYDTLFYEDVGKSGSIALKPGAVAIPSHYPILDKNDLSEEMRFIIDMAKEIYDPWVLSTTVIQDEQPRLLLVFQAKIPQGAATLRVNLGKVAKEVADG